MAQQEFSERRKRYDDLPELPEGRAALLLSAIYSGEEKKAYLKFYDPSENVVYHWRDRTGHKPYCYSKVEYADMVDDIVAKESKYTVERVRRKDVIADKEIDVLKISAPDPLSIGGTENSIREKVRCWESDIKYHENYLYDNALIAGLYYIRRGDKIEPHMYQITEKVQMELTSLIWDKIKEEGEAGKEYRQYVTNWANLLNQPIPELRRVSVDIEVEAEEGRMPTAREHDRRVTAVGFAASDGLRKVLVLGDNVADNGQPLIKEAEICMTEKELLEKAFAVINSYPIILTFNGDDFDLPYLYARSQDPRIDTKEGKAIPKDQIPMVIKKESFIKRGMQAEPVGIRHGIHIDLFRTLQNRSIQIYAFSRKYTEFTLNAISEALLEDSKIEFDGDISDLPMQKLAEYCLKDADLTFRLTSFGDNLLMKLLVVIARIGRLSVDDIARFGVNQWIRGILYYEHRQRNELIPRTDELAEKGAASTAAVIKEKKYRGGEVVEPTPGIHFNVVVLDFASLYPSIIKVHNLSYETINCVHDSCKQNGRIEGTTHWVCQQRKGLSSLLIGSLRDLRVNYYKQLSKDKTLPPQERQLYNVVSQAIKVILNACFTGDTEVLTPAGVRNIKDLKVGDTVYTLNETTHRIEIKPVVETQHYKYNDDLIKIRSPHVDWSVTGNHKLYLGTVVQSNGTVLLKWNKLDASNVLELTGRRYLFRHGAVSGSSEDVISLWKHVPKDANVVIIRPKMSYDRRFSNSSRWRHYSFADKFVYNKPGRCYYANKQLIDSICTSPAEFEQKFNCALIIRNSDVKGKRQPWQFPTASLFKLIGWYVTEGSVQDTRNSSESKFVRITITQSLKHESNRNHILSTIQSLGYTPRVYGKAISFTSTLIGNFLLDECSSGSKNKHLPSFVFSASPEHRETLLKTMMWGDGSIEDGIFSSISKSLAQDFQHLAFTLGIETAIRPEKLPSGSTIFRVQLYGRKHHCLKPQHYSSEPVTNLDVYCITAQDNHIIYAGRNGKMGWIGQSYGVLGFESFPLYCIPVADATAAIGRNTIHATINKCKELGIEVVYGDTDSMFLKEPSHEAINKVMEWAKDNLGVDLEVDKQYRYVVFSNLKKNYLGVMPDGTVDVKGLTGKKSHTPPFIRNAFYEILEILGKVNSQADFETARESIKSIIQRDAKNLESHAIPMQDLSFNVMINKSLSSYGKKVDSSKTVDGKASPVETFKGLPQHIKAARLLSDRGREIKAGDIISYVKTKTGDGVKPVELAKADEIDIDKYLETMESTLDQVLAALNFDFKSMLGKPRQQSLDELFWSKPPM